MRERGKKHTHTPLHLKYCNRLSRDVEKVNLVRRGCRPYLAARVLQGRVKKWGQKMRLVRRAHAQKEFMARRLEHKRKKTPISVYT